MPFLVKHFVEHFNAELGRNVTRMAPALLDALRAYPWPGNVRELKNVVENMVLFARGEELTLQDLPAEIRKPERVAEAAPTAPWVPRRLEDLERETIFKTLEFTRGHRARAAELLGIGLRTLQRKLKEYGNTGGLTSGASHPAVQGRGLDKKKKKQRTLAAPWTAAGGKKGGKATWFEVPLYELLRSSLFL